MTLDTRAAGILTLVAFLSGGIAGAVGYKTLAEPPAKPTIATVQAARTAVKTATSAVAAAQADLAECHAKNRALQALDNREGQPGAVTPHPYSLHPNKTPLIDPTRDAYYRKLLEQGRFPTSGSDPGRPR